MTTEKGGVQGFVERHTAGVRHWWGDQSMTFAALVVLVFAILGTIGHFVIEDHIHHRVTAASESFLATQRTGTSEQVELARVAQEAAKPHPITRIALTLSRETSFAAFVAVFLMLIVEVRARRRHNQLLTESIEKMQTEAYLAAYKLRIPRHIFEAIEHQILHNQVIRDDHRLIYSISPSAVDGKVDCEVRCEYFLQNLSTEVVHHPLKVRLPLETTGEAGSFYGLYISGKRAVDASESEVSGEQIIGTTIKLDPGQRVEVWVAAKKQRLNDALDYWSSKYVCTDTSILVSAPLNLEIHVAATFGSGNPEKGPRMEELPQADPTTRRWRVRGVLLPGNAVFVRWKPKHDLFLDHDCSPAEGRGVSSSSSNAQIPSS